jgi:hypothetical protein
MSLLSFDITYKKKTDIDAFKLSVDAEYQQLKFMICGKYRIYDLSKIGIFYKNELLTPKDNTKLKDIFKIRKIKLEIVTDSKLTSSLPKKQPPKYDYFCLCKKGATYICDKCDEYICESCYKKKKHLTHSNKIIKLSEYPMYIKSNLKEAAAELDAQIVNDEAYQFFNYWQYDLNNEITNINQTYDFLKKELEDMKQMQIDYLINVSTFYQFDSVKEDIEDIVKKFASVNVGDECDKMLFEKKKIIIKCREILIKYSELKSDLFQYTTVVKDMETFNSILAKELKEKFTYIKKKYFISKESLEINSTQFPYNSQTLNSNNTLNKTNANVNMNFTMNSINNDLNKSQQDIRTHNMNLNNNNNNSIIANIPNNNNLMNSFLDTPASNLNIHNGNHGNILHNNNINNLSQTLNLTKTQNMSTIQNSSYIGDSTKLYFKLKDDKKMLIFNISTQGFKEKIYNDNCNFKENLPFECDVMQLNIDGKLYILSGQKYNKFYYYDYPSNSVYFISDTLHTHYYGSFVFCKKNNSMYLIGGNNQLKNEIYHFDNNSKCKWENLPPLNEERQEFGCICVNNFIYVFFGFSPMTGKNLSSIECINVDKNEKFEIIYANEHITLSAFACARYSDEEDEDEFGSGEEILLLGGFDGKNFVDTSLIFNVRETKIRDSDIQIPDVDRHKQFLFQRENAFLELDNNLQIIFDMRNNIHLISGDSYELFWEAK